MPITCPNCRPPFSTEKSRHTHDREIHDLLGRLAEINAREDYYTLGAEKPDVRILGYAPKPLNAPIRKGCPFEVQVSGSKPPKVHASATIVSSQGKEGTGEEETVHVVSPTNCRPSDDLVGKALDRPKACTTEGGATPPLAYHAKR